MEPAPPKEMAKVQRYGRYAQACSLVLFIWLAMAVSYLPIELSPQSLMFMLAGSLIVFVSWIFEIGRRASEDAERLRSEAELTV
jgi:lipopolysaccharide export LptBFGC system permease protein LptF